MEQKKDDEESTDPVYKLRKLAQQHYKTQDKNNKKIVKGGVFPLIPIGIAVGSAVASKLAGDLYDWLKNKISGSGMKHKMNHKSIKDKKIFLKDFVNQL